jgi:hypothetical protein
MKDINDDQEVFIHDLHLHLWSVCGAGIPGVSGNGHEMGNGLYSHIPQIVVLSQLMMAWG